METENTSVETQEVAELEESVETQEVAELEEQVVEETSAKTEQDSAFAEIRRRAEQAEADREKLQKAMGLFFDGDTPDDLVINARATARDKTPEEVRAEYEAEQETIKIENENQQLREQLEQMRVTTMMEKGLQEIQSLDKNVKSLTDLGEDFPKFISAGLSSTEAYYAIKAKEQKEKVELPKEIGKVNNSSTESDFYTEAEVDNMSQEEIEANLEKVLYSQTKWH